MPNGVFEIPAVLQGVPHVLVVQALGVKDLIQCSYIATRRATGPSRWWPGGVHFFPGPFVPALVLLLVHVLLWCWGYRQARA